MLCYRACPDIVATTGGLRGLSPLSLALQWLEEDALRAFVMHGFGHQHGLSVIQWGFSGRLIGYYDPARPGQELGLEDTFHIPGLGLSLHRVADDVQVVAMPPENMRQWHRALKLRPSSRLKSFFLRKEYGMAAQLLERLPANGADLGSAVWTVRDDGWTTAP